MKSWADHCSSDEESLMEEIEQELVDETEEEEPVAENETAPELEPVVVEKTYVFPDKPPFTAFVGNLAYSLKEAEDLKSAIGELTESRLGTPINVLEARVAIDNRTGQHRGFGYLELETLEDLKSLMQLNDGNSVLAGRKIQFDTADSKQRKKRNNKRGSFDNFSRGSGFDKVDGSKFRGGKYNDNRRSDDSAGPPAQRTSLKLAPRTKPREGDGNGSSSDIFGGGKARDEGTWEKKKLPDEKNNQERRRSSQKNRNRGKGGGKDGGGRGKGDNKNNTKKDNNKGGKAKNKDKPDAPKPAPAPAEPPKKAAAKPPINKFALLMNDSDSD